MVSQTSDALRQSGEKFIPGKSKNSSEITEGALVSSEISVPVNVSLSFKYPSPCQNELSF